MIKIIIALIIGLIIGVVWGWGMGVIHTLYTLGYKGIITQEDIDSAYH